MEPEEGSLVQLRVTPDNLVPLRTVGPYFVLGLLSFAAAPLFLWPVASALEAGAYRHPWVLIAVHVYAVGWGTAIALGSLQQLSPVLAGSRLHSCRFAGLAFLGLLGGLAGLLFGFLSFRPVGFIAGSVLLPTAVVLALLNIILTQRAAPMTRQGLLVRPYLLSAAAFLVLTAVAGAALASHLATGWLGARHGHAFGPHVTLGILGWFALLILGVSYHMLPFFGLTEKKRPARWIHMVRRSLHVAVALLLVASFFSLPPVMTPGALLLVGTALTAFLWEHRALFSARPRSRMHPIVGYVRVAHGYLAAVALSMFGAALHLITVPWRQGVANPSSLALSPQTVVVMGVVVAAGWLSNTILGYLHRILPFIVWHNKYWGRGKEPGVPAFRVMVNTRVAWVGLSLYNAGVVGMIVACLTPLPIYPGLLLWMVGGAVAAGNLLRVFWR